MEQCITVTSSDQNACDFVSNFAESINLNEGYEVAVTRIFHGPLYNVTTRNHKFTLVRDQTGQQPVICDYFIPVGYYMGTCDILDAIRKVLLSSVETGNNGYGQNSVIRRAPTFQYTKAGESSTLKITDANVFFLIDNSRYGDASLLSMLGYCVNDKIKTIIINHYPFDHQVEAGFLYSNIVANTMINQHKSRLLAVIPIQSKPSYNYHEFVNPIYNPISVHAFTNITFTLTDVHGEIMNMDTVHSTHYGSNETIIYPTIITLHMRKIKNIL